MFTAERLDYSQAVRRDRGRADAKRICRSTHIPVMRRPLSYPLQHNKEAGMPEEHNDP